MIGKLEFSGFAVNGFATLLCGLATVLQLSDGDILVVLGLGSLTLANGFMALTNWNKWRQAVHDFYDKTLNDIASIGREFDD